LEEAPKPVLDAGTVIVQVKASAICGSELGPGNRKEYLECRIALRVD
jgi:threonine dehydrogenase-like Zn-dependent dehydrogenase